MKLIDTVGRWAEWLVVPLLGLASFFSYQHENYLTAVVNAACTGFVLAVNLCSWMMRRKEREHQRELDAAAELARGRAEVAHLWSTYGRDGLSRMLNGGGGGQISPPCRWCGRTTPNPNDIMNRYCPCCGGPYMSKNCPHRPRGVDVDQGAF